MTLEGTVRNGVVVPDQSENLSDGTRVRIVVPEPNEPEEATFVSLLELAGTVEGLPPDMARNHNHYLHGHPKQ